MAKKRGRAPKRSAKKHVPTRGLYGWITHTELASSDPAATKAWCEAALGWKFKPSFPMPGGGEYHLFTYSDKGGGGIRRNELPEVPGSIPYIHVADARKAFQKALSGGAEEMYPPERGHGGRHQRRGPRARRRPDRLFRTVVRC